MAVTTLDDLAATLTSLEIPWANTMFEPQEQPAPPFIVLTANSAENTHADNVTWASVMEYDIELYCERREYQIERAVQAALDSAGIAFEKSVWVIEQENLVETVYSVLIDEE